MTRPVYALVVTAHPDDAEFAVAGSVAGWTRQGKDVAYVICTNGDKGTSDRRITPEALAVIRKKEQIDAAAALGVREVEWLGFPDQGLEDTTELRKMVVRMIRKYRPKVVVTSDPYRRYLWHRDHRIIGQVVVDAVFPYARDHLAYPDLLEEGFEPHKVEELLFWAAEDLNHRIDITETFDVKMAALRCHKSQVGHRTPEELEDVMKKRYRDFAKDEPFELAEAFHRIKIPY
jgi:LmbE family N-acetylglucosaminyl deacetylase